MQERALKTEAGTRERADIKKHIKDVTVADRVPCRPDNFWKLVLGLGYSGESGLGAVAIHEVSHLGADAVDKDQAKDDAK